MLSSVEAGYWIGGCNAKGLRGYGTGQLINYCTWPTTPLGLPHSESIAAGQVPDNKPSTPLRSIEHRLVCGLPAEEEAEFVLIGPEYAEQTGCCHPFSKFTCLISKPDEHIIKRQALPRTVFLLIECSFFSIPRSQQSPNNFIEIQIILLLQLITALLPALFQLNFQIGV